MSSLPMGNEWCCSVGIWQTEPPGRREPREGTAHRQAPGIWAGVFYTVSACTKC